MPANNVPTITATLVIMLIVPLARLRSESSTNSGIMPYLAGPKNELWQVSAINADERDPEIAGEETDGRNDRDRDLDDLDPHRDGAFGVAIGQLSGVARQQNERDRETDADDPLATRAELSRSRHHRSP